jgi:hypothetical protein
MLRIRPSSAVVFTRLAGCWLMVTLLAASAAQIDIAGPAGSVAFGSAVKVLANGNIVVVDSGATVDSVVNAGAVYVYDPTGSLISTLTGSSSGDQVGSGGISLVGTNTFVVLSPVWNNSGLSSAGAVTFVDGAVGLTAAVTAANSLVGANSGDQVGNGGIVVLANGNYVVGSHNWNNSRGAVTWEDAAGSVVGAVSSSNSLVGVSPNDYVGVAFPLPGIVALSNGNYVVVSPHWNVSSGAVTWGDGVNGTAGEVSTANSLYGSSTGVQVGIGGATEVGNGNYVVASPNWSGGAGAGSGAATWCSGTSATGADVASASTSLFGSSANDSIAQSITALDNGNYVVGSPSWDSHRGAVTLCNGATGVCSGPNGPETHVTGTDSFVGLSVGDEVGTTVVAFAGGSFAVGSPGWNGSRGAVTLIDGTNGRPGEGVSAANSLVGAFANDQVGLDIVALDNGNFLAQSPSWNNSAGAVTWVSGSSGLVDVVAASNSLVGSNSGDTVGQSIVLLASGNYVVGSPSWQNHTGAATWGSATTGVQGAVSQGNSLTGSATFDVVGAGITALSNGNYVVGSSNWNGGIGAATWADGTVGQTGFVSPANSLVGANAGDYVGDPIFALANGNYVVAANISNVGAATWRIGTQAMPGVVSSENSLFGTSAGDVVGGAITAFPDGSYAMNNAYWNNSSGAATFGSGTFELRGTVQPWNSVIGLVPQSPQPANLVTAYDAVRKQLAVGRPLENIVSLFTPEQIFSDGFD